MQTHRPQQARQTRRQQQAQSEMIQHPTRWGLTVGFGLLALEVLLVIVALFAFALFFFFGPLGILLPLLAIGFILYAVLKRRKR